MSCGSGVYDVCIAQGTTYSLTASFTDDNGDIIDISSWSGIGPLKARFGDSNILNYFNLDFSAGTSGILTVGMHRTGTAALPVGQHLYEIELYPSIDTAVRYLWGYAEVSPEVSI